ncbi:MAG: hypothetical protein JWL87_689 [Candidatus Adlerbacteria bacterium]|nr:hypothetical protein [Candidatus Adlerbacteria bacterium]
MFLAAASAAILLVALPALADSSANSNFENPPYVPGNINGQDGWSKTGAYDAAVTSSFGVPDFGNQSLRISNAVTSSSFADQTFAKPTADGAGEADSTSGGFATGTLASHFQAEFDLRSVQLMQQPGLSISVSPDRGDGSRMSYLRFEDQADGIHVFFNDAQGSSTSADFVETDIATLSRATTHTIGFSMDFVNGPSNDVVEIYIDGALAHTGTSWENYYRFDPESAAEQSPRIVKTLLFRAAGTAATSTQGLGYLIDNLEMLASGSAQGGGNGDVTVTISKYIDGTMATSGSAQSLAFPMNASWNAQNIGSSSGSFTLSPQGSNSPNAYQAITADMTSGASYSVAEDTSGANVAQNCSAGKPYSLVGYTTGTSSAAAAAATPSLTPPSFSNLTGDQYVIVWNHACTDTGTTTPPTTGNPNGASVDQNGSTVRAGGHLDFVGRNFGHEQDVAISLGGSVIRTVHADGGGNFSTGSMTAPATPGTYQYEFKDSGHTVIATITVVP